MREFHSTAGRRHSAPWSISLIVVSTLTTLLCLGIPLLVMKHAGHAPIWAILLPPVLPFGCALFTVRGYTITSDSILVQRLFWSTQLPRTGLQSAHFDPKAMRRSLRTWGNGGVFSFTGFYRNKLLGPYRAFVTDPRLAVVLRFAHRTVVVSPGAPEVFIRDLGLAEKRS
jgi:hypothetical protein